MALSTSQEHRIWLSFCWTMYHEVCQADHRHCMSAVRPRDLLWWDALGQMEAGRIGQTFFVPSQAKRCRYKQSSVHNGTQPVTTCASAAEVPLPNLTGKYVLLPFC
mmetsp:Transcript_69333/g.122428  ORF Transcript_69333/g.122428 Transcript_69333/m.122428 type:complete len:106 (-) Transcript_69333:844-1161(-)